MAGKSQPKRLNHKDHEGHEEKILKIKNLLKKDVFTVLYNTTYFLIFLISPDAIDFLLILA